MKDYIRQLINKNGPLQANINRVREYIQENFLYIIYKKKFYAGMVFCGGTALRFLYKIRRFSEDLDFSLAYGSRDFDFLSLLDAVKKELSASGYDAEIRYSTAKNVNNAFINFPGLLAEYGLSGHEREKLSIKLEIDTNPPAGGKEEISVYNGAYMFHIRHYDIASLLSGKLHAILERKYVKGRDWYDLLWYRTKFPELSPNFALLNAALKQTGSKHPEINENNWKKSLLKKVENLDIKKVKDDVSRFLEDSGESSLLTRENFTKILGH